MLNRRNFLSSSVALVPRLQRIRLPGEAISGHNSNPCPRACPTAPSTKKTKTPTGANSASNSSFPPTRFTSTTAPSAPVPRPCCAPSSKATNPPKRWTRPIPRTTPSGATPPGTSSAIPLAAFVGCHRDEIALLRNATEANSYIANGIDLKPGDEVLITDQEHPGGEHPWDLRAKRYGIVIKKITLPKPVINRAQILESFQRRYITPRTRVFFFSHITTVTGVVLPAKELCALARSKGFFPPSMARTSPA